MGRVTDIDRLMVIAPNFKRRLSGVTSTIIALVPAQAEAGLAIAALGPGLPDHLPKLWFRDLWKLWRRPVGRRHRIWHARRNTEMLAGIVMRDILRMPLKLVFTSASQREHTRFTKWMIARMDRVIATSAKSGYFLDVPHTVIMHGVDTDRFCPPDDKAAAKRALGLDPDRFLFGCSGRIRHSKGTDLFVDAMIALLPDHADWEAVITGRATAEHAGFKRDLEARIATAGLTDRIRFTGEVPDMVPWYQAFDVFVAPSRVEGFGLTPLEAMACGVPAVASDAGAFSELIEEGKTGHVLADLNPTALKAAATALMTDAVLRRAMSGNAHAHVKTGFSLDGEVAGIGAVYGSLLRGG